MAATQALQQPEQHPLFSPLKWLMLARAGVLTFLLVLTFVAQLRVRPSVLQATQWPLFLVLATGYALTGLYALVLRRAGHLELFTLAQLGLDVALATAFVYLTGGMESIFTPLYVFVIIGASMLLYRRGAMALASLSSILYGLLVDLQYYGVLPAYQGPAVFTQYTAAQALSQIILNVGAFYLVALLSSTLSEQLRRTGQELRAAERGLEQLGVLNQAVLQSIPSGLLVINGDRQITRFNRAAEGITGYSAREVLGKPLADLFAAVDLPLLEEPLSLRARRLIRREIAFQRRDGQNLRLGYSLALLRGQGEEVTGHWILIFQDVTRVREMEEEIRLARQAESLPRDERELHLGMIIGKSPEMAKVYEVIQKVSDAKTNLLLSGESGTGKELVARAIHENSPRRDKPFVAINCGAIPVNLLESELFGHKKGSFTGAVADHRGLFEVADGGTMFLDEVAELPSPLQVKLLRVIQERTIRPVGGTADIKVDVRLISATNKQLEDEVRKGTFREDLFYRLNVIEIRLPPLRQRREDIPVLAQHFLEKYAKEMGKGVQKLSSEAMAALMGYGYPGNIRELENIIERSVALETMTMIRVETLPPALLGERKEAAPVVPPVEFPSEGIDLDRVMETIEREWLLRALDRAGGVKTKAAALLGINRRSLHYRLAKYELEAGDGEESEAS